MDPKSLALSLKPQLEAKGYAVDAQGNVRYPPSGGGIHPPWAWMQAFPDADVKLKLPGSDPNSAWHGMYSEGGPFTNRSSWDQQAGTYEGGIDWGTLLGTIGVGSMFAAPALAAAAGGGGAAGSAAGAGAGVGTAGGGTATTAAGAGSLAGGAKVGIASTLTGIGKKVATDAAGNAVNNLTGGGPAPQSGGSKTAEMMALLGGLLAGQALKKNGAAGNVPPELSQLLQLGTQRAQAQQPMFNAVNQGVFSMLPNYAKDGIAPPTPMNVPPSAPPASPSGGGMNPALLAALSAGGGMGLGGLVTGTNPYGAVIEGLKKLFGRGGSTPSGGAGTTPYSVVGPPDPSDPWNGDPSQTGGG